MRIYALPEDLVGNGWLDAIPDKALAFIREASQLVEEATSLYWYDVDDDGMPTKPRVVQAFTDATCAQVAVWVNAGLDPTKGATGQGAHISSQSVPGGSVNYTGTQTTEALGSAATELAPNARLILTNARIGSRALR